MKKSRILIAILFAVASLSYQAKAQGVDGGALTKLTPVKVPEKYEAPTGKIEPKSTSRINQSTGPYSASYWMVFSDRDNNQTYKDKNLLTPYSKINFKEVFIVADETDNAVRLVAFDGANLNLDEKGGKFDAAAKDAGWIAKSKLLLWSSCLVDTTNNSRYAKKAVAVKKLSNEGDYLQLIKRGVLDFYNAPVADKTFENDKDVKLFQYLFIFKEENNMCLLANINVVKPSTFQIDMYGWVPKTQIQEWSSAMCLRINFDEIAIDERTKNKIEPKFFRTEAQAMNYRNGKEETPMLFLYSNPTENENDKDNPYLLGYPITATTKNPAVFKTGYVTNTVDKKGNNIFSALKTAKLTQTSEQIINKKENIKIVFVLDGNDRNFYNTLTKAIDDNPMIGSTNLTNNKYQLGAVVFNDIQCGEEEAFVKISFKSSKDNFIEHLKAEAEKKLTCIDRTTGAPLCDAIKKACDFFDDGKTTNIIIVIGSESDNDNVKKDAALKALISKNVKMFYYQISNKDGKPYDNYLRTCKYFLTQMASSRDEKFASSIKSGSIKKAELYCDPSGGENCKLINSAIPGEFHTKDEGRKFTAAEVNNSLKALLIRLEDELNKVKASFDENMVGTGKAVDVQDENRIKEFQSWLQDEKIPQETIDKLATMNNYQLFIEGYTALKPTSVVNPIFEKTLFVAEKEFQRMINSMEQLEDSYGAVDKRANVIKTCKDIIMSYKGKMDDARFAAFSLDDIYNLITGMPTNNKLFKKSLKEINNTKLTTDAEIDKMKIGIHQVLVRLREVKKGKLSKYEQDDQLFYWVAESKLSIED